MLSEKIHYYIRVHTLGIYKVLVCMDILLHTLHQHQHNLPDIGCRRFYHQFRRLVRRSWIGRINTDPQCKVKNKFFRFHTLGIYKVLVCMGILLHTLHQHWHNLPYIGCHRFSHQFRRLVLRSQIGRKNSDPKYKVKKFIIKVSYFGHLQQGHSPSQSTSTPAHTAPHELPYVLLSLPHTGCQFLKL